MAWPGPAAVGAEMEGKEPSCASPDSRDARDAFPPRCAHPQKLARSFVSGPSDRPQAVRAMRRITLEMGESSMAIGVAVFWVRRAVA